MHDLLTTHADAVPWLQLQARVWEPAAERLLQALALPRGAMVLDVGCGPQGWLRPLQRAVAPAGTVVGADIDQRLLDAAAAFCTAQSLYDVELVRDDLFASRLEPRSFDLVHARLQQAALGRPQQQIQALRQLVRPGGWLVLEEPDTGSWRLHPDGTATADLQALLVRALAVGGGDLDAGRRLPGLLRDAGLAPQWRAEVVALEPGHPYLALPLHMAQAVRALLVGLAGAERVATLLAACEQELARPGTWGTSFTLVQAWTRVD